MNLGSFRPLYDAFGGYVSVYLDASRAAEDAAQAIELRWRALRSSLAEQGADGGTLDEIGQLIGDPANAAAGLAVIASHRQIRLHAPLRSAPGKDTARYAALPHLMPLLAQRPPRQAHLRVSARRDGGEVIAITAAGHVQAEHRVRDGWPVHKAPEGNTRHQHSAEAGWEHVARELASAASTPRSCG